MINITKLLNAARLARSELRSHKTARGKYVAGVLTDALKPWDEFKDSRRDEDEERRAVATEQYWKDKQGEEYGSY